MELEISFDDTNEDIAPAVHAKRRQCTSETIRTQVPPATVRAPVIAAHAVDDPPPLAVTSVVAVGGVFVTAAATARDLQADWVQAMCVLARVAGEAYAPRPCTPPSPLISGTPFALVTLVDRLGRVFLETS